MAKSPELSLKGIFFFSIPSIAAMLLEPLASVVDSALIGHKNTLWLAAIAIATTLYSSFSWIFNFLVHVGAQKVAESLPKDKASNVAGKVQVVLLSALAIGLLSALLMFLFRESLYWATGAQASYIQELDLYYSARLIGHPFSLLYLASLSIIRAHNRVFLSFALILSSTLINIVLSSLSLFVWDWGIEGVAWATNISIFIGSLCSVAVLFKMHGKSFIWNWKNLDTSFFFEFQKDSLNMFFRSASLTLAFWWATKCAGHLGVLKLSAHQILLQLWLFLSLLLDGVAVTATILVAQNSSFIKLLRLRKVLKSVFFLTFLMSGLFLLIYSVFYHELPRIFSKDPLLLQEVYNTFYVLLPFLLPSCLAYVFDGVLFGLNEYKSLRKHMILAVFFLFAPISAMSFYSASLIPVWIGLGALNFYRCISGFVLTRNRIKKLSFQKF